MRPTLPGAGIIRHEARFPAHRVGGAGEPEAVRAVLRRSSWDTWKAVVKAMFGEPLNAAELALFRAVAERDPPIRPVREMAAVAGRGAGKDSVATVIAAVMAVNYDPRGKLRPGERAVVMLLAVDREQAKIAFNYIAASVPRDPGAGQAGPARH